MTSVSSFAYAQYFVDLLETNKATLQLKAVFYGDQQKIAHTPTACVEPGIKRRVANGAPRKYMNELDTHIILYHGQVQGTPLNQLTVDMMVTAIEDLIHADATLGTMAIDSYVKEVEHGYQTRGTSLFRASMLTVEARQQELLPLNF